ncbi:MAG TPA: histidine kinase [Bryobacteraceae bacterium]|nr:histidine kinase [Bryobacteraceae bacterium]
MNHGSNSEADAGGAGDDPLLMECGRKGQVLFMTEAARAAFGPADNLADAMRSVAPSGTAALLKRTSTARFSPVLQEGDSLWITAELAGQAEVTARGEAAALLDVQWDFLRNYFRLQNVERALSTRTLRLRQATGAQTLFQIERERERLGREMHTGLGQTLAAIRLQLEIIARQSSDPPSQVQQALSHISMLATEALDYVRSISKRLLPPEWQRLSLETALAQLFEISGVPQGFEVNLQLEPLPHDPALEVKVLLYRAAQEALSNLVRHARARRVEMTLRHDSGVLVLTVRDDGVGFDAERLFSAPAGVASGIGLRSIREQAASLGGQLRIQSGPNGTTLEVSAPFTAGQVDSVPRPVPPKRNR